MGYDIQLDHRLAPGRRRDAVSAFESLAAHRQIWHVSYPEGVARKITNDLNDYSVGSITADGKRIAVTRGNATNSLVLITGFR